MARQRRDDQNCWLTFEVAQRFNVVSVALESNQITKRLADFGAFIDGHVCAADPNGLDAELRFYIVFAQAVHQIVAGRDALHHWVLGKR